MAKIKNNHWIIQISHNQGLSISYQYLMEIIFLMRFFEVFRVQLAPGSTIKRSEARFSSRFSKAPY